MGSEMPVFARFSASCLGIAPPVVRPPLSRLATRVRTGVRRALSRAPHLPPVVRLPLSRLATRLGRGRVALRPAPIRQSGAGRERQGLVHKANGLVGSWFQQC